MKLGKMLPPLSVRSSSSVLSEGCPAVSTREKARRSGDTPDQVQLWMCLPSTSPHSELPFKLKRPDFISISNTALLNEAAPSKRREIKQSFMAMTYDPCLPCKEALREKILRL